MDIEEAFHNICVEQQWNGDTQFAVLFSYIKNQQSDAAFLDHLREWIEDEENNDA